MAVATPMDGDPAAPERSVTLAAATRWNGALCTAMQDELAVEEPCEILLDGETVAVVMRTPVHDEELAAGFLFTEGIINGGDIADIMLQRNRISVRLRNGVRPRRGWQRTFLAGSACGICGTGSIRALQRHAPPLDGDVRVARPVLAELVERLEARQDVFAATGGIHAAALFTAAGELVVVREDIGRHNAVDKVVGYTLLARQLPLADRILVVSGRTSFEIAQKALMARIPIIAGVSAASSLAVRLAADSNMTLIGFLRGSRMNVYTGDHRLSPR